jgi:hypothetical protein
MFNLSRIREFFSGLLRKFWDNKKLYNNLVYVEDLIPKVGPFIKTAADIITGLTPTTVDDMAWKAIKEKYPQLFSGQKVDPDTAKLYALGIATDLVERHYPEVSTTVARTATQLAYLLEKSK